MSFARVMQTGINRKNPHSTVQTLRRGVPRIAQAKQQPCVGSIRYNVNLVLKAHEGLGEYFLAPGGYVQLRQLATKGSQEFPRKSIFR